MSHCLRCAELKQDVPVQSPQKFLNVLRVIRDNLNEGTLFESAYWPPGQLKNPMPLFSEIKDQGPWPDILHYYFECADCKARFELFMDSYHGKGGSWSLVK